MTRPSPPIPAGARFVTVPPPPPPESPAPSVWRHVGTVLLGLGVIVALAGSALLRQAGVPSYATLYAEDGGVFLTDAYADGAAAVGQPYARYLHAVPRLLALGVTALPPALADAAFALGSALLAAALAVFVFCAARGVLRSVPLRLILAGWLVLGPVVVYEALNNATNLHWLLTCAAAVALLLGPRPGRVVGVSACLVVAAAALSSPLVAALVPLALLALRRRASPWDARVAIVFLAALAVQATVVVSQLITVGAENPSGGTLAALLLRWAQRVLAPVAFGQLPAQRAWTAFGWWAIGGAGVAVLVVLVLGVVTGTRRQRALIVGAAAFSVAFFLVMVFLRGPGAIAGITWFPGSSNASATRYSVVPGFALLLALLVSCEAFWRRSAGTGWGTPVRAAAVLAAVGVLALWSVDLRALNARSQGPQWDPELLRAAAACHGTADTVDVPIPPRVTSVDRWIVVLPCRALLGKADVGS